MKNGESSIIKFNQKTLKFVLIIYLVSCIASLINAITMKVTGINDSVTTSAIVILTAAIVIYGIVFRICYVWTVGKNEFNMKAFNATKGVILFITYFHYILLDVILHSDSQWMIIFYFIILGALFFDLKMVSISMVLGVICMGIVFKRNPGSFTGEQLSQSEIMMKIVAIVLTLIGIFLIVYFSSKLMKEVANKEEELEIENEKLVHLFKTISEISADVVETSENLSSAVEEQTGSLLEVTSTSQRVINYSNNMIIKANENKDILNSLLKANEIVVDKTSDCQNKIGDFISTIDENLHDLSSSLRIMDDISDNINTTFESAKELEEKSSQVDDILNLIGDISEQTNLLALNASIEAARAGEYGKGFAVVAEEIRKLAEGTKNSLNQVSDIVGELKDKINIVEHEMENNNEKSQTGNSIINKSVEGLKNIGDELKNFSINIIEIGNASETLLKETKSVISFNEEVSDRTNHIIEEYEVVNAGIERNTAANEEIEANVNELGNVVKSMNELIK